MFCPACEKVFPPQEVLRQASAVDSAPPHQASDAEAFTPTTPARSAAAPDRTAFTPEPMSRERPLATGGGPPALPPRLDRNIDRRLEDPLVKPPSGAGLARAAQILLGIVILGDLAQVGLNALGLHDRRMVAFVLAGEFVRFFVTIPSAIVFMLWFCTAYTNLRQLGIEGQTYSPGWAIGYFFIPFLNLVRPYEIAQEIWKGSDPTPQHPEDDQEWKRRPRAGVILAWWLLWLLSNVVNNIQIRVFEASSHRSAEIDVGFTLGIIAHLLSFVAGLLLIRIIGEIVRRQSESWRLIEDQLEG